jgi:uncharacterized membrane protein (DUF2068 family)
MKEARRPLGLKAILAYKFAMAPVMLALGVVLILAPAHSLQLAHRITGQISESGSLGWRAARALEPYLTPRAEHRAAVVAWLDGLLSLAEGLLLLSGRTWGEWIVIAGLGALLPIEAVSLARHPRIGRAAVLLVNAAVVAYLVRRRLKAVSADQGPKHGDESSPVGRRNID